MHWAINGQKNGAFTAVSENNVYICTHNRTILSYPRLMQHCKPIKAVRLLMRRHHEWISSFSTNFVAAVLGIALTFGTTMWYENQKKRESAEAQRLWTGEITHEEFRDETRQRWDSWHR